MVKMRSKLTMWPYDTMPCTWFVLCAEGEYQFQESTHRFLLYSREPEAVPIVERNAGYRVWKQRWID